jgi:hypothetical protein
MNKSEIIQLSACIVAFIAFVFTQISNQRRYEHDKKQRNISSTLKLMEDWRSISMRDARDFVYTELKNHSTELGYSELPAELRRHVKSVSYLCDEIALRVMLKEADENSVRAFIGDAMFNLHAELAPYIATERRKKGSFQEFFTAFVLRGDKNSNSLARNRLTASFNET